MIAFAENRRRKPAPAGNIYELKVELVAVKPPVWRRLRVPGKANLNWLHAVLQVAMGWTNSHLHQFEVDGAYYSDTDANFAEYEDDPEIHEGRRFKLQQIAPNAKTRFKYRYDFGDCWEHEVVVEKILPADAAAGNRAICIDGARACPPEDCGGPWGYERFLKALKNKKHPEHRELKAWIGGSFDAETFDIGKLNFWLGKLKWPNPAEGGLRKILMGRDGYKEHA